MTTKLIPEKTVEQWMTTTLVDLLGRDVWLWSDTQGWDQHAWIGAAGQLSKWVLFELKAPDDDGYTRIRLAQLHRYVNGFKQGRHPDVLYVLPDPPWDNGVPNATVNNPRADPWHRWTFDSWAYVIRASDLHQALGQPGQSGEEKIVCQGGMLLADHRGLFTIARPLWLWLMWLVHCTEPAGTALRKPGLITTAVQDYEGWELTDDSLASAAEVLNQPELDDGADEPAVRSLLGVGITGLPRTP